MRLRQAGRGVFREEHFNADIVDGWGRPRAINDSVMVNSHNKPRSTLFSDRIKGVSNFAVNLNALMRRINVNIT